MTLIKRGPGAGRKSSRSYDDDSSSRARGSRIQAGQRHRDPSKIGLAMNSSSTVSAELGLRLVATPQTIVPLTGSLSTPVRTPTPSGSRSTPGWKSPSSGSSPATCCRGASWAARASATCKLAVARPAGGDPGSVLTIELISPYGRARFETPAREVTDFLRRAYQIVPDGQESGHIDLDAELNDLLRQAS